MAAAALSTEDSSVDITGDIDGAPAGCLMFGTSPVFAQQDDDNEGWCNGCTVLCELDGRGTCAAAFGAATCADPGGVGVPTGPYSCFRGVNKTAIPTTPCPGGRCTDAHWHCCKDRVSPCEQDHYGNDSDDP